MSRTLRTFIIIQLLAIVALYIALPPQINVDFEIFGRRIEQQINIPPVSFNLFGKTYTTALPLKQGLDIQGGMQVVLRADMTDIAPEDQDVALESARDVILRRVDLYGINEPSVTTSKAGSEQRLLVDLPGVSDTNQALQLVGTTAQLDFKLFKPTGDPEATTSAVAYFNQYESTGLTGKELKRAQVTFDQQTGEPVVSLEFDDTGRDLFAQITEENIGQNLAIFIDEFPIMDPVINSAIYDGRAVITGGFDIDQANQLAIQLNAGALPVSIEVLEQRQLGASIGQAAVQQSVRAGIIGIGLVMLFMILLYGWQGLIADWALTIYGLLTIALYKIMGVTLTLPGIAGMLLTIGMAVDANILIFERLKEELRLGKPWKRALELGFGRAWDSIKDANVATIMTALILINPFDFNFLNTSGLVRGFGITLLIGVLTSLFTGVVVTRNFMRLFLKPIEPEEVK